MAPLGIGLFTISLAMILVLAAATSLFIFQKRLTNYSEELVLFAISTGESEQSFLTKVGSQQFRSLRAEVKQLEDGLTHEARACAKWTIPFRVTNLSWQFDVCSHARARSE